MTTFTPKAPISEILKTKEGASNARTESVRPTRDEYRKTKELEEGRKAGTVPAVQDVESGRDINPHIPQFITDSPWYSINGISKGATLKHQRPHPERVEKAKLSEITEWYKRGTSNVVATKFRKGACGNCGAMTHKAKDCFERPRKIGAKFTGEDIAPDEHLQPQLKLWYDAKRDRYNGYNPEEHSKTIAEYQALEEARRMLKAEEQLATETQDNQDKKDAQEKKDAEDKEAADVAAAAAEKEATEAAEKAAAQEAGGAAEEGEQTADKTADSEATEPHADEDLVKDEDKYAEDADMPGVHVDNDSRTRITVRNLRIREDTAKYLYNLDPESAYYDPKSRSMRENPFAGTNKEMEQVKFKGENFIRFSGEVTDVNKAQLFAWEAKRKGIEAHQLAEPTKLEQLKQELTVGKASVKEEQKQAVIARYGGAEHLKVPPKELLMAQTEAYVEYNRKGQIVKGVEKPVIRSKYPEDIYHNNHTAVWGSFWHDGRWGYACCHSCVQNSYCTGEAGKSQPVLTGKAKATDGGEAEPTETAASKDKTTEKSGKSADKAADKSSSSSSSESSDSDSSSSSSDSEDERTKKQLEEERKKAEERRTTKRNRRLRQKEARKQKGSAGKPKRAKVDGDGDESDESSDADEVPVLKKTKTEQDKIAEALKRIREAEKEADEQLRLGDRRRKYNVQYEYNAPTDHDMEAYRLTQQHHSDPMAAYFDEKKSTEPKRKR